MPSLEYRANRRRIISVDGEGKTIKGRHGYFLLAAADDRSYQSKIVFDIDNDPIRPGVGTAPFFGNDVAANHGLTTRQCLDFLLNVPEYDTDLVISFSFMYDVTMILQDLPHSKLLELVDNNTVEWEGYQINVLPRKYLEIRTWNRKVTIWDTFSYWQMSFVAALESSLSLFSPEQQKEIAFISRMKAGRADLNTETLESVIRYCYLECTFLSILFRNLLIHIEELGLPVRRFSGPGGIAEAFFTVEHITEYMPDISVDQAATGLPFHIPYYAYYGGRFETRKIGIIGTVTEHDIHSAYPAIAVTLPCLACGYFERVTEYEPDALGFYYVGSHTDGEVWAPFPFRVPHGMTKEQRRYVNMATPGSIVFAHGGKRWVTSYEVEAARAHYGAERIPVYDGYVYRVQCAHKPFERLAELYLERKIGNVSEGYSKIIKLLINSVYGKLAQAIGETYDSDGNLIPPKFQCLIWAAWITGGTRAKVFDAAMTADETYAIATDSVLCRNPIPNTATFKITDHDLGTWDQSIKENCWIAKPGIYSSGYGDDESKSFKRRGLSKRYFPASHLRREWERGEWMVYPVESPRAFMPYRLAMQRRDSLNLLGQWPELPSKMSFFSNRFKRHFPYETDPICGPHDGTNIILDAITIPDDFISEPYRMRIEQDESVGRDFDYDMPMWSQEDLNEKRHNDMSNTG